MKTRLLLLLALLASGRLELKAAGQPASVPVRLAIVPDETAATVGDLLTVELSRRAGLQLLERAEIEKVYREQALSAGQRDYLKLGRVLAADGLLIVETVGEGQNRYLNSRLVAVKPGVMLTSAQFRWPLDDTKQWATGLANHLHPLLPKLAVLEKDAVPVSVVNLRSAVQSAAARESERQLTLLTIERLSREPRLFILERRRMQFLSAEQELAGIGESAFWNGSYLLEGAIDRDGYSPDTVTISARLVPPQGGAPLSIEVSGSRTNLPAVINQLAGKVLESLKLNPSGLPWKSADEARQYHDEAAWALRWQLYEQAQAAGESAWALGHRTKATALLRLRSYSESVLNPEPRNSPCNLEVPSMPDTAKLLPANRALELVCQDASYTATNPAILDSEWFDAGLQTLRVTARFLEGFYYTSETRRGHEGQLTELRSRARQAVGLLKAGALRQAFQDRMVFDWRAWDSSAICGSLEWLLWEEGGIWHEQAEDALPGFRELLENGYAPSHLPRVIGWSWPDRQRVPRLLRQFVDELTASTNPLVRLEGRYLELLRAPDDVEGGVESREQALLSELWTHRRAVLEDPVRLTLLPRAEEAMRDKRYQWSDPNRRLEQEPLVGFVHQLRKDYLLGTNYDVRVYRLLFPTSPQYYSQSEARELLAEIEAFRERTRPRKTGDFNVVVSSLRLAAGSEVARRPVPTVVWPAEKPLEVKFTEWQVPGSIMNPELWPYVAEPRLRNGKIWSWVNYSRSYSGSLHRRSFLQTDLTTGACTAISFPPEFDQFYSAVSMEVTGNALYAWCQNRFMRYRFLKGAWEEMHAPFSGQPGMLGLNGRLYIATPASLLEFDPDSEAVQILASALRRPPANELDAMWDGSARLFLRSDQQLGIQISNRLFAFNPATRGWSSKAALPGPQPFGNVVFLSGEGGQWLLSGFSRHRRLVAFWNHQAEPELLLEQRNPRASGSYASDSSYGPPRWNWPEPFRLDFPLFIPEGQRLWMMHPRILRWRFGGGEEPIRFQDDRQATLLLFTPERKTAIQLPIAFRKDGQPIDPFERFLELVGPSVPVPPCIVSDQGLVVVGRAWAGHWLIPASELQRLKPLPDLVIPPMQSNAGTNRSVTSTNSNPVSKK